MAVRDGSRASVSSSSADGSRRHEEAPRTVRSAGLIRRGDPYASPPAHRPTRSAIPDQEDLVDEAVTIVVRELGDLESIDGHDENPHASPVSDPPSTHGAVNSGAVGGIPHPSDRVTTEQVAQIVGVQDDTSTQDAPAEAKVSEVGPEPHVPDRVARMP